MHHRLVILLLAAIPIDGLDPVANRQALGPAAQPPIVGAVVENVPPHRPDIRGRQVRFRIATLGPPRCDATSGVVEYGFLVDSDRRMETGVAIDGLDPLRIDARIAMRCDPRSGQFTSPLGPVSIRQDAPGLDLTTTVGQLPSIDFLWAPYGRDGSVLSLPEAEPRYSRWAIIERVLP